MTGGFRRFTTVGYFLVPLVLAMAVTASIVAVRAQGGGTYVNPDAGLTDAQRDAKYKTATAVSGQQQYQLTQEFIASGISVANLPQAPLLLDAVLPPYDLNQAVAAASEIVDGTVQSQRVMASPDRPGLAWVISTLSVRSWLKGGDNSKTVELRQLGVPGRDLDGRWSIGVIASDPVAEAGHEVIVLSSGRDKSGRLQALGNGVMTVDNGMVQPNPNDPNLAPIRGTPVGHVRSMIRQRVIACGTTTPAGC